MDRAQDFWWNQPAGSVVSSRGSSRNASHSSHFGFRRQPLGQPRELEFQFFIRQTETFYPPWWTRRGATEWFRSLPDDHLWNWYICACVLLGVVWTLAQFQGVYVTIIDAVYNVSYAVHMFAIGYYYMTEMEHTHITSWIVLGFLVDIATFAHYAHSIHPNFKLGVYYVRFHRPFRYLWSMNDYNLKGSILGTAMKYCYIFTVLRLTWAYVWQRVDRITASYYNVPGVQSADEISALKDTDPPLHPVHEYLASFYIISKMFIPMGPSIYPDNDVERIVCVCIMMTGCLIVVGAAVASLSLIISIYMRPEETFRSRYRLMMKEMSDTQVPANLRAKVKTFYKMYWHRQRGVSATQLLPTFPPTLPAAIYLDIYFEATQKARILRDLSIQMLSELAQKMTTIHFIPGDAIIQRGSKKCKIIYITYGDVEMLTAEDDNTAILRLTRGTVLTPCGGAVAPALSPSHLAVRAATFCTAHVLKASELWRVVYKHSVSQGHAGPILAAFTDHVERVKRHYSLKIPDEAVRKSSILQFNRNLMSLKGMKDENGVPLLASSDIFLEIAGCYIMRNVSVCLLL
ncbi:hypothetical protein PYW07_000731 [Mythimna separata]|uniref:Cyclic nucleotide-binding domain-containing protein n=1 Tax=Mythimna separata TaxID=271217 RepID=A0AAD7YQX4_MYTSE|nr:hypothetical protein PYW07_000731 [Mythimna separata]